MRAWITRLGLGLAMMALAAGTVQAGPPGKRGIPAKKELKPYPLSYCVVSGEAFEDEVVTLSYRGQEVKLCCKPCRKKFQEDPEKWMTKIREAAEGKKR